MINNFGQAVYAWLFLWAYMSIYKLLYYTCKELNNII